MRHAVLFKAILYTVYLAQFFSFYLLYIIIIYKKTTIQTCYVYCVGVCDIEKKRYLDIFGDFVDNNNLTIFCRVCYCADI